MPEPDINLDDIIRLPDDHSDIIREPSAYTDAPANVPAETVILPPEVESEDNICVAVRDDELPEQILKAVIWGFAEEQASLKDLRKKRGKDGKDTSYISLKRGMLLKYMSETLIQKQALLGATGEIDLRGPKFREVFKMFLEIISQTFDEVKIPAEYREMFFHQLSKNLEGWEERAEKAIKAMTLRATG